MIAPVISAPNNNAAIVKGVEENGLLTGILPLNQLLAANMRSANPGIRRTIPPLTIANAISAIAAIRLAG